MTFIILIVLFLFVLNLSYRIKKIEQIIVKENIRIISDSENKKESSQEVEKLSTSSPKEENLNKENKFIDWIKEDWLLKVGAIFLLIGFGWLTTYAFLNNWIGPMGRISFGIIAGTLFILLGWWRIKKYINQGGVFLVIGSTTILITLFAAREIYNFFTPFSSLFLMFLSTAFVGLASAKYKNRGLAISSLILAGIAPLLTNSPTVNYVGLFSYLIVVILGIIWIVTITGIRELTMISLVMVFFYSSPYFISPFENRDILLIFAYIFSTLFFLTNTIGIIKNKDGKINFDLITSLLNGLFLLFWINLAVEEEWKSLTVSSWMIVFSVASFLIFKITKKKEPFYVYTGIGIAMLAAATSFELKGATLTIAYIIETGIILFISYLITRNIEIIKRLSLISIGPILLSFESIASPLWRTSIFHKDFFVLFFLSLVLFGLGIFFLYQTKKIEDKSNQKIDKIFLIVGSIYFYILLWLSFYAGFNNKNIAVLISLFIYTTIGIITYFYGFYNKKRILHLYGGVVVGFVIIRLILIDIWQMDLSGRIFTFFIIGTILVSTAFISRNKKFYFLPNK